MEAPQHAAVGADYDYVDSDIQAEAIAFDCIGHTLIHARQTCVARATNRNSRLSQSNSVEQSIKLMREYEIDSKYFLFAASAEM